MIVTYGPPGAGQLTTAYAVLAFMKGADLLLTCASVNRATFRTRWLLFADRDIELYEDLYVKLCPSHDRRMDDKRVGCVPLGRGPYERCGDLLGDDVLAMFDEATMSLFLGPAPPDHK